MKACERDHPCVGGITVEPFSAIIIIVYFCDMPCMYMKYMKSIICLSGYDIMNVGFCRIVSE